MEKKILSGMQISPGIIEGNVAIVKDFSEINKVNDGDILVVPYSHPMFSAGIMKANGLICQEGGRLSHVCIVALEMGIPCITQAQDAIKKIGDKKRIKLDANEGAVYEIVN